MTNDIYNELGTNFIEYAYACNSDRAIPDATSGLKPVAKRILWAALESGYKSDKKHVKCAKIVGDVMGGYHPHGDSSIYGALVRLSQSWTLRYPLLDFHGSNGNIAGDGPASMRYTEARLSKLAEDGLLAGIKKKNVDFIPNYDETLEEPVTLPAIFPNLLCNPNKGIGVAIASGWACHNLKEVAESIKAYIKGKKIGLPGPDFPTGGIVINKNDIPNIMNTGHGSVKIRGRYKIEDNKIIFYEIPYGESIEGLIAQIGKVCDDKVIEGINDVHDESNKNGLRIVITVDKGIDPEVIVNKLFAKTDLQSSFSYNQVALVGKTPTELNLYDCFDIYINHNRECLLKELTFDINKAKTRKEIVDGLLKALASIDDIIALIKGSESSGAAKDALIKEYNFSENQAKAILAMRLSSLAKLEGIELEKERAELDNNIQDWIRIVNSQEAQIEVIIKRLDALVDKYGDDRRTELTQINVSKEEKEKKEIVPEDVVVIVSQTGDVKRIPKMSFKVQKKNGKGVKSADAAIMTSISTNTLDTLMIFTNLGKMYRVSVDKVPVGTNTSKGVSLHTLAKMNTNEKVVAATSLYHKTNAEYVVFFTKNGYIKKTKIEEYNNMKKTTGIQAIKLKDNDTIINVTFLKDEDVIIITKNGMSIRFKTDLISPIGRVTMGVKAISLKENDTVLMGIPIKHEEDNIAIITEDGMGKQVPLSEFPVQARAGKGVSLANAPIAGAAAVSEEDNLLIIGQTNSIYINAKEIPIRISRYTTGTSLIKTNKVLSVVKVK